MILLDLIIDIAISVYTSLGFGTKEYKIESKMEKIKNDYPQAYEIYLHNKIVFESDEELSRKIIKLNIKDKIETNHIVNEIYTRFTSYAIQ